MGFIRDPVWQFIGVLATLVGIIVAIIAPVNALLAIVIFITAIIIFIMLYPKLRPNKTIFFRVIADTVILSIKEKKEFEGELKILFKGDEVKEDIHLVFIKLWNASNSPILSEEYKNPIRMDFGQEAKILSTQVLVSNPLTIKEEIDNNKLIEFTAGKLDLKPIWLNTDNSLIFKVLLTKFQGEVSTDESRIIVGGYVRSWNKSSYSKAKKMVDKYLKNFVLFITVIIFFSLSYVLDILIQYFWGFDILSQKNPEWMSFAFIITLILLCIFIYYYLINILKKATSKIFE